MTKRGHHPKPNDVFEARLETGFAYLRFVEQDTFADVVEVYRQRDDRSPPSACSVWGADSTFLMYVDVHRLIQDGRVSLLATCANPPARWEPRLRRQPIYKQGRLQGWIITDGREGQQVESLDAHTRRLPVWVIGDSDFVVDALEVSVDAAVDEHVVNSLRRTRPRTTSTPRDAQARAGEVEHDLVFRRRSQVDRALREVLRSGWEITSTSRQNGSWYVTVCTDAAGAEKGAEDVEVDLTEIARRAGGEYGGRRTRIASRD